MQTQLPTPYEWKEAWHIEWSFTYNENPQKIKKVTEIIRLEWYWSLMQNDLI